MSTRVVAIQVTATALCVPSMTDVTSLFPRRPPTNVIRCPPSNGPLFGETMEMIVSVQPSVKYALNCELHKENQRGVQCTCCVHENSSRAHFCVTHRHVMRSANQDGDSSRTINNTPFRNRVPFKYVIGCVEQRVGHVPAN